MIGLEVGLQRALENIYRIEENASVDDFRIGVELLEALLGSGARDAHRETLLVQEQGEYVDLALYIADDVVDHAHAFAREGGAGGDPADLDGFCVATEGVSHFVYVLFCGARERPVSHTELELQAEIDKFIVLRVLFELTGRALLAQLYDRFELAARLDHGERERYTVANRAGRRYAGWLEREFARGRTARALDDARALYRKPLAGKLEHIARAA